MNCYALSPEGEDLVGKIITLSHGISDNMHGLDGVSGCTRSLDVTVCEQALPWQMGPRSLLQSAEPPYGKPPAPDEEQNSRSSCLCLCHMRLQAMELKPCFPPEQQPLFARMRPSYPLPHLLTLAVSYIHTHFDAVHRSLIPAQGVKIARRVEPYSVCVCVIFWKSHGSVNSCSMFKPSGYKQ